MDFGRTNNLSAIDFRLPPTHTSVKKVLGGSNHARCKVYVGGVLWNDISFLGNIYPQNAKPKDYAKFYTQQFNCIELNSTHYRLPAIETIEKWTYQARADFKFCPKIIKDVSHAPNLANIKPFMDEFLSNTRKFDTKLGLYLLQFPPALWLKRKQELIDFLANYNGVPLAIELRHEDWFLKQNVTQLNALCNFFYKSNFSFVLTDTPLRRDLLHMRLTNKKTMVRFLAHDLHETDFERITEWLAVIKAWMDEGLEEIYFFIHSPNHIYMPELVSFFIKELKNKTGINLLVPKLFDSNNEKEKNLFS